MEQEHASAQRASPVLPESEDECVVMQSGAQGTQGAYRQPSTQSTQGTVAQSQNVARGRRAKVPRQRVPSVHLSELYSAYTLHFKEYSKDKKGNVCQIIPGVVWKACFDDYKQIFPNSVFVEETLKERLRKTIRDMDTGTSNKENSDFVVLQSADALARLRRTKGHCMRNVLDTRDVLASGKPVTMDFDCPDGLESPPNTSYAAPTEEPEEIQAQPAATVEAAARSAPTKAPPAKAVKSPPREPLKPAPSKVAGSSGKKKSYMVTKAAMLREQSMGISSMANTMQSNREMRDALLTAKADKAKIANLRSLKDSGAISEEEFKEKAREVFARI